jgi:hypothetical protein
MQPSMSAQLLLDQLTSDPVAVANRRVSCRHSDQRSRALGDCNAARADAFDDIELFYIPRRRQSTLGQVNAIAARMQQVCWLRGSQSRGPVRRL